MSAAEKKRLSSLDHRPQALRAAIKRNTQMNRQLSKVRNSLRNEERESQQLLKRGNHQLVAKLNALRIIKEIKSPQPPTRLLTDSKKAESLDKINTRSNSQRKKLYRQPTQQMIPDIQTQPEEEAKSATPTSNTDQNDKYQMPSWKRAELMMKQKKEDERNTKIYGKRGGGRTRNSISTSKWNKLRQ